ncbi:MAG: transposase [Spirochaetaceae bacterium]|nr:transposase [Spirochaetaceae bacterium]
MIIQQKENMKNRLKKIKEKMLLRKKEAIKWEVNDYLKNICSVKQSCHRRVENFVVHLLKDFTSPYLTFHRTYISLVV